MSQPATTPAVSACHAAILERGLATAADAATLRRLAEKHSAWLLPADKARLRPLFVAASRRLAPTTTQKGATPCRE